MTSRMLPQELTDAMKIGILNDLVAAQEGLQNNIDARKLTLAESHEEAKGYRESIRALTGAMKTGAMLVSVPCEWKIDSTEGTKVLLRMDTREIIEGPAELTGPERQMVLFEKDQVEIDRLMDECNPHAGPIENDTNDDGDPSNPEC